MIIPGRKVHDGCHEAHAHIYGGAGGNILGIGVRGVDLLQMPLTDFLFAPPPQPLPRAKISGSTLPMLPSICDLFEHKSVNRSCTKAPPCKAPFEAKERGSEPKPYAMHPGVMPQ